MKAKQAGFRIAAALTVIFLCLSGCHGKTNSAGTAEPGAKEPSAASSAPAVESSDPAGADVLSHFYTRTVYPMPAGSIWLAEHE